MREEILNITMTVDGEQITGTATDQVRGPRGYSAYEVAVLLGYVGNEESWLESLKVKGDRGSSAYRVAVDEGFVGTVSEWRDSLIGPRGPVYDDSDLREQIDLELASLTRIASEAADVATTKAGEAVEAKNIVVLRADEVDGHAVILYGLFDEIEDYRQEVYRRAVESVEQAGIATTKAGEAVISAGEADQSAQDAAQSASEAEQTLIDKVSKADIVQTAGQSSANIMSQKAVTNLFNNLVPWLGSEIPAGDAVFDFEKNRYVEKGIPVGLSDISEFIRLSSATEWYDGKLVEVVGNSPRISSAGLLIERSVTESIPNNSTITSTNTAWTATSKPDTQIGGVFEFVSDGSIADISTNIPVYPSNNAIPNSGYLYRSILAKKASTDSFIVFGPSLGEARITVDLKNGSVVSRGSFITKSKISDINEYYLIETLATAPSTVTRSTYIFASNNRGVGASLGAPTIGHKVTIALPSMRDTADLPQSVVKTSGTQVTRAPDILNIPLLPTQTITGDWDEGVTYEVTDGIATFTGHGYIRNIVVEEL